MGQRTRDRDQYERLGHRLRQAREAAGLTQEAAAGLLERPQSFVSRSETGDRRVDVIELAHFARAYGSSLTFFLEGIIT